VKPSHNVAKLLLLSLNFTKYKYKSYKIKVASKTFRPVSKVKDCKLLENSAFFPR